MAKSTVLRVTLTGDSADAVRAIKAVATELAATDARYKTVADSLAREADRIASKQESTAKRIVAAQKVVPTKGQIIGENVRSSAYGKIDSAVGGLPGGGVLGSLGGAEAVLGGISAKALAASAGIAAVGAAAVVAGQKSVAAFQDLGGQVQQFAFLTGQSAEASSGWVGALNASGIATDQWVDRVRQFQTNLAQSEERFSAAGVEIQKFSDGTTDATSTMMNALVMMSEMPDKIDRQRVGFQLFGESWTQLQGIIADPAAFNAMRANYEGMFTQEDLGKLTAYNTAMRGLKTDVTVAGAEIGVKLVPALTDVISVFEEAAIRAGDFAGELGKIDRAVSEKLGLDKMDDGLDPGVYFGPLVVAYKELSKASDERKAKEEAAAKSSQWAAGQLASTVAHLEGVADASAGASANLDRFYGSAISAGQAAQQASAGFASLVASQRAGVDIHDTYVDTLASVDQIVADVAKGQAAAAQAAQDSGRRIADASRGVEDAQVAAGKAAAAVGEAQRDAAKQVTRATEQVEEAYQRQAEAIAGLAETQREAQEDIADYDRDSAEKIEDAQQRIMDARDKAARNAEDNARKLVDAEQGVADALLDAVDEDNPYKAQRKREEALLKLARTQEDIAEDEQDAQRNIAEAIEERDRTERDVAEGRAELHEGVNKRIAAAQREVSETAKGIATAQEALAEAEEGASKRIVAAQEASAAAARSVDDAQRNLNDAYVTTTGSVDTSIVSDGEKERKLREIIQATYDEVAAAKIRGASEEEIQTILNNSRIKVDELGTAWKIPVEKITTYQSMLTQIPTSVNTQVVLTMNAEQYRNALWEAARGFQDPMSQMYVAMGGELVGGAMPVPDLLPVLGGRASGGPVSKGTWLVGEDGPELLHMGGSGYVSPNSALGGTTNNFNMGMFVSERSFEAFLADMRRKGYNV